MAGSNVNRLGQSSEEGIKGPVTTAIVSNTVLYGKQIYTPGQRVLLTNQTDTAENGIWNVREKEWTRAVDFNRPDDVVNGQLVGAADTGTIYGIAISGDFTPGVTAVTMTVALTPDALSWGSITGTLSAQTDVQSAIDAKTDVGHSHIESDISDLGDYLGDSPQNGNQYARNDGVWEVVASGLGTGATNWLQLDDTPNFYNAGFKVRANATATGLELVPDTAATVGIITDWPLANPPTGWLECDGAFLDTTLFSELFTVLGYTYGGSGPNFRLPDFRGKFSRGWDNGAGNDPDRLTRTSRGDGTDGDEVGTNQTDEFRSHIHEIQSRSNNNGGPDYVEDANNAEAKRSMFTDPTGGNETRPINIYMMKIISFLGVLQTGAPGVAVEDDGIEITDKLIKLNFIGGFQITEPVDDEIDIRIGPATAASEWCPGYTYTFINTTQFSVQGFDIRQIMSVGRRIKFSDAGILTYGQIITSVFSGGNTVITMEMEGTDLLTNTVNEFCLVTGSTAWSPIAGDPFGGTSINSIISGNIGATVYWVAVGDGGKIASSVDGGVSWVVATSGTTENLYQIDYSPDSETFICIGNAEVINRSTDGLTWVVNTSEISTLKTDGDGDVLGIQYAPQVGPDDWILLYQRTDTGTIATAYSTDDGLTWSHGDTVVSGTHVPARLMGFERFNNLGGYTAIVHSTGEDVYSLTDARDSTSALHINTGGQAITTAYMAEAFDGVNQQIVGHDDGRIYHADVVKDDVTFGASGIRGFAFSETHNRAVAVADDGKIGYISELDLSVAVINGWALASNNSDPTANFMDVHWNSSDGLFIAVNDIGQILRSSTGIGDPITTTVHTGFTLIAADPMAGTAINDIAVGTIGGTVYWVICGNGGQIFTSTDAGVTWTSRSSGVTANLITIGFDAGNEQFMAGGASGEFTTTTDGTTWTGDTSSIALLGGDGSDNIVALVFDDNAGLWWIMYAAQEIFYGTASADPVDLTDWTVRDVQQVAGFGNQFAVYDDNNTSRIIFNEVDDIQHYSGATDASSSLTINDSNPANVTAFHGKSGTNGNSADYIIGTIAGDLSVAFVAIRAVTFAVMSGPVRGIAFTTVNNRYIAVGDGNDIVTLASADTESANRWENVNNPFTGNILAIAYNATDDIMIAVGSNGEIGRSVDGIS